MIKPDFWDDEKLATQTSRDARLVFIALWNFSDDYGVVKGNPVWLKNHVFPYDDSLSIQKFTGWLSELSSGGWTIPFERAGEQYFYIRTFTNHQTINRPSRQRNPEPPDEVLSAVTEDSRETHGAVTEDSLLKYKRSIKEEKHKHKHELRDDDFEKFWQAYPKKKDRAGTKKVWDRLCKTEKLPESSILLSAISEQRKTEDWAKSGGQFIPYPSTWLNGMRWEDSQKVEISAGPSKDYNPHGEPPPEMIEEYRRLKAQHGIE